MIATMGMPLRPTASSPKTATRLRTMRLAPMMRRSMISAHSR
jgi:hypothetical protein